MYAFVRCAKLSRANLGAMQKHAKGLDSLSSARRRADAGIRALGVVFDQEGTPVKIRELKHGETDQAKQNEADPLAITDALEAHLKRHSATLRKGAAVAMHLIVGVDPEWVSQVGDLHDPKNPRNKRLLQVATDWAIAKLGGVFAARIDVDETGGAVVDIFSAPIHHNKRSGKASVSVNQALKRLTSEVAEEPTKKSFPKSFSALQDSWTDYANEKLGTEFERGRPKTETHRKHLAPEEYAKMAEEQKQLEADRERVKKKDELADHIAEELDKTVERVNEEVQAAIDKSDWWDQQAKDAEARVKQLNAEAEAAEERAKKSKERSDLLLKKLKKSYQQLEKWQAISADSKAWRKRLRARLKWIQKLSFYRDSVVRFFVSLLLLIFGIKPSADIDTELDIADDNIVKVDRVVGAIKQQHQGVIAQYTKDVQVEQSIDTPTQRSENNSEQREMADKVIDIDKCYQRGLEDEKNSQKKIKEADIPLIEMAENIGLDLSKMDDEQLISLASESLRGVKDENVRKLVRRTRRELGKRGIESPQSRTRTRPPRQRGGVER